jgi:DNA mismatch endonuclease Vsr
LKDASFEIRSSFVRTGVEPTIRFIPTARETEVCRYRKNRTNLPGAPDVVFPGARVIAFVDGDFWHGKNWKTRKAKLAQGHNANDWIGKIEQNAARDRE